MKDDVLVPEIWSDAIRDAFNDSVMFGGKGATKWDVEWKGREPGALGQKLDILALYVDYCEGGSESTLSSTKSKLQLEESRKGLGVSSIHVLAAKDGFPTLRLTLTTYNPQEVLEHLETYRDSSVDYTVKKTGCNYYVSLAT